MFGFYDKLLHEIGKKKGSDAIYINIGAMDGIMFDDSASYVSMYGYKSLYVEPIPYAFNKLKNNIKQSNASFENSAISDYDGIVQMITIDNEPIDNGLVHPCFYGMSAIYPPRNGLNSDGDKEIVEKYGKMEIVPCITLSTLFKKYNINYIDILSIDTEGHDWKIIKQLDLTKYRPSIIRAEYINLDQYEKEEICSFFYKNNYIFEIQGQNIDAIPYELYKELFENKVAPVTSVNSSSTSDVTIVTGLWNIGRKSLLSGFNRSYEFYKEKLAELMKTSANMYIYVSKEDEEFIWTHRSKENTVVKIMELEEFDTWFEFMDQVQSIRNDSEWKAQASWLEESPQANLKYYNPIVLSKMFLLNNAAIFNHFDSKYFYWIDAGITNTVHPGYFYHDNVFNNLPAYTDTINKFLFISYPYVDGHEIHGFNRSSMTKHCNTSHVDYVCRGGFFGGKKEHIHTINGIYHSILFQTLSEKLMGTEESIFTILSYNNENLIHRFEIKEDGLIWPFFEELKNVDKLIKKTIDLIKYKTNLYVLGFNSPDQFERLCISLKQCDENFIKIPRKILVNNSTDSSTFAKYDELCEFYGFEEIHLDNIGICGGRQFIAEHFDKSSAKYYIFFEDDMCLLSANDEATTCKMGLKRFAANLYNIIHVIMKQEGFDFLKLSFSEFYGDNSIQWAWYNVPQSVRTEVWPEYDKLPEIGLDPNSPRTKFNTIKAINNVSYISGQIYYSNWPQIVSRAGNKKMFLDVKWNNPFEQTWMSHIFQETLKGNINPAILLMSPVEHDRFDHYKSEQRREN